MMALLAPPQAPLVSQAPHSGAHRVKIAAFARRRFLARMLLAHKETTFHMTRLVSRHSLHSLPHANSAFWRSLEK